MIKVLPPEVVAKIAAGEVVERPASVVKELVENSLDAGAAEIAIEARGGGVAMVRVTDNGCGVPAAEATLAFRRHATNKISGLRDLDNIRSLGFRGEGLASIAAVAEVDMLTQTSGQDAGIFVAMKEGNIVERGSRARAVGTTVTVRNLFSTVPARLKFLKSAATENSHIANVVNQYALGYPRVKFNLFLDGRLCLKSPGSGSARDAVASVYGAELAGEMLEVAPDGLNRGSAVSVQIAPDRSGAVSAPGEGAASPEARETKITGLVSPLAVTRGNSSYISLFVNHRWVKSRSLAFAVEEAYKGLLMTGKHPIAVLYVELPFSEVDVNVHPTKMEVRFRNEHALFASVQKVVRQTIARQSPVPQIETAAPHSGEPPRQVSWDDLSADAPPLPMAPSPPPDTRAGIPMPAVPILRVLGQLSSTYIIAEGPEGLYLIDQHAAHERVLYEEIMTQKECRQVTTQGMLEPLALEVTARQDQVLKEKSDVLSGFGFNLEPFGEGGYLVRGIPAVIKDGDIAGTVRGLIDALAEGSQGAVWDEIISISLACHGAVKAGQTLSNDESRELVRRLEKSKLPRTCPHGRPTMLHLSSGKLEREFGRR